MQTSESQVGQHLRGEHSMVVNDALHLHYHSPFDDEVWTVGTERSSIDLEIDRRFSLELDAVLAELLGQRNLIDVFEQARSKALVHLDRAPDDFGGCRCVAVHVSEEARDMPRPFSMKRAMFADSVS